MATQVLMPALSPTMEEGTLAKWLVKEGDMVKSGQILAEIETDKATMEFEAVDEGKIGKLLVAEGTQGVKVNTPIAVLVEEGESADAAPAPVAAAAPPAAAGPAPGRAAPVAAGGCAPFCAAGADVALAGVARALSPGDAAGAWGAVAQPPITNAARARTAVRRVVLGIGEASWCGRARRVRRSSRRAASAATRR